MKFRKSIILQLEHNDKVIQLVETADSNGVEFIIESGGFTINREEAELLVRLIDPHSYNSERFRYKRDEDETV